MKTGSRRYMEGSEFKKRQGSFEFFCAQAVKVIVSFVEECRKGWKRIFEAKSRYLPAVQLSLDWAEYENHLQTARN